MGSVFRGVWVGCLENLSTAASPAFSMVEMFVRVRIQNAVQYRQFPEKIMYWCGEQQSRIALFIFQDRVIQARTTKGNDKKRCLLWQRCSDIWCRNHKRGKEATLNFPTRISTVRGVRTSEMPKIHHFNVFWKTILNWKCTYVEFKLINAALWAVQWCT